MANVLVTINRSGNNLSVSVTPSNHVSPGDTLAFTSTGGDFAIFFKNGRSPHLNDHPRERCGQDGETTHPLKIRKLKPSELGHAGDPKLGDTFSYGIAVLRLDTGQILTKDPDIIIDDPDDK